MRRLLLAAGAVAILVAISGCDAADPRVTPAPTPSATPVFASDEEALAAAEAAYAAYVKVASQVFAEGGQNPERLESVATGDFLATSIAGFENVQKNGWRSVGESTFSDVELQQYEPGGGPADLIVVYLCDDVSQVNVLDQNGASVVSSSRPDKTYFQVSFDLDESNRLLVSGREVWGDGTC